MCESSSEIRKLLDSEEFQFRFDAGVTMPSISVGIEQDEIVRSLIMHYLVFTCKAELDQLKQGLSELSVGLVTFISHTFSTFICCK